MPRGGELKYVYLVDVEVKREPSVLKHCPKQVSKAVRTWYQFPAHGENPLNRRPVIIGAGPAGLFCGLMLARNGYAPVILERGERAEERARTVETFWLTGKLNPTSNVQFGEGGAGTFSDGKLNTMVKDPVGRNRKVLELFVEAGAPEEILYENKPHLGTDQLIGIVTRMRKEIEDLGGEVRFGCRVTDLLTDRGQIRGVSYEQRQTADRVEEQELRTDVVVLAIGHSARDTFSMLKEKRHTYAGKILCGGSPHGNNPQHMINESQIWKRLSGNIACSCLQK